METVKQISENITAYCLKDKINLHYLDGKTYTLTIEEAKEIARLVIEKYFGT